MIVDVDTTPVNRFDPTPITVAAGDTVVFHNADFGFHNVHFDDGLLVSPRKPSPNWGRVERTFSSAGSFSYHCDQHASIGMRGVVKVVASRSELPGLRVRSLKVARARKAIRVRIRASARTTARITVFRGSRKLRSVRRAVTTTATAFSIKHLRPGSYRVTVKVGRSSKTRRIRLS